MAMKNGVKKLVFAGVFLALCLALPFLTGQIPEIGSMLLPMHLPVLICGFVCGRRWGAAVGVVAPLLRSVIFGMPPLFPTAVAMAFELAAYGYFAGLFYRLFPKKPGYIYLSLLLSLLAGRIVWGGAMAALTLAGAQFSFAVFIAGAFVNAWPGIVLQIVLVPPVVLALKKAKLGDL